MTVVFTISAAVLSLASANILSGQSSWCSRPPLAESTYVARARNDVQIAFVSRDQLAGAMRRLSRRSIIPLNPQAYRVMTANGAEPPTGSYLYLARAGVLAPIGLRDRDFIDYAERAGLSASQNITPGKLNIVSLMTSTNRQETRNFAVLIASPVPVNGVVVRCLGGR